MHCVNLRVNQLCNNPTRNVIVITYLSLSLLLLRLKKTRLLLTRLFFPDSRKDLILKGCQPDILLITGMRSPYSGVVEKMYKELDRDKVTILKIDKVGDVLAEAVSEYKTFFTVTTFTHDFATANYLNNLIMYFIY